MCGHSHGNKINLKGKIDSMVLKSNEVNEVKNLEKEKNNIDSLIEQKKELHKRCV